ncbi:MAG: DUF58 domain-containing protein, partial [Alphaproteobacteria bacterium]|nr:DUF58 domain-containing protein [Alphaproteobacteria bacterium]
WRVTARTGKPHTKLFHEEREKPVHIVVDARPPMRFGTRVAFKSVIAARVAAALAWKTLEDGDRVGGLVMTASGNVEIKPLRSRRRLLHFLQALSAGTADGSSGSGVELSQTLTALRQISRYGGQVYLISDFYDFDEEAERHLARISKHCDVGCVFVHDPLEEAPPPPALYRISDGERVLTMNAGDALWCKAYSEHFAQRREKIENFCRERRIAFTILSTDDELSNVLRYGLFAPRIAEIKDDIPEEAKDLKAVL